MGICCSKAAKPISTSSSRPYVSVITSPDLFPTENQYKKDSAVASHVGETFSRSENASAEDFKEQRSTSEFTEKDVDPMRVDLCEVTAKQTEKQSLENTPQRTRRLTVSVERCDEKLTTEDADGKVIASQPHCAGAITRLKKKDSTRQPRYKDEIMLSDNIDSIVEKEIPEIPDEESALERDIEYILNDDIPAAESNGQKPPSSGVKPPRPSKERNDLKPDNKATRTGEYTPGAIPTPKTIYSKRRTEKKLSKDVQQGDIAAGAPSEISSVSNPPLKKTLSQEAMEEEEKGGCSEPTPPCAGASPKSRRKARKKTKRKKSPEQAGAEVDFSAPTTSSLSQMSSGSSASLEAEQHFKKNLTREKGTKEDEKLTEDINYILNDDVGADESNEEEEELANDIAFIMSDDIITVESNGHIHSGVALATTRSPQNPKKYFARKQKNKDGKELPKKVDTTLKDVFSDSLTPESSSVAVSSMANPQRLINHSISEKEVMNDQKLEDDIAFILNDDIIAPESVTVPPKRKIKPPVREKKRTDVKKLAESKSQIASGDVSPKKAVSFQETNEADDELDKDIEYILKDDIVEVACNEKMSSSLGALPPPKKITFTKKHCKQDKLEKDIQYILNDDIPAEESNDDEIFSSPSEIPRPKTSNPKLTLAMDMDRIFDPESIASPNQADDALEEDIAYILSDNIVDVPSSGPMPFRSGGTRRLKKQSVRKSKEAADLNKKTTHATSKLVKGYSVEGTPTEKTLRSVCAAANTNKNSTDKSKDVLIFEDVDSSAHIYFDSGYSVVTRSPKNSSCEQKRAKIGEKADDQLEHTKNMASIGSINSCSSVGTPFKTKHPTRKHNYKTEKVNWEEAINKILAMSKGDSDASRENLSDDGTPLRKTPLRKEKVTRQPKPSERTEEDNLEEAINEILEIPIVDSRASVKNLTASGTSLRKNHARQPKRSKHTEDVDLEEAISDILEIPTLDGESKKATKLGTLSKERKTESRKKVDMFESRGTDTKTSTAQALANPDVKLPDAKASSSSIGTKNCYSGSSVASGDSMRPMAARSSRMTSAGCSASPNTVTPPFSNTTRQVSKRRQTLPAILKKENSVQKSRMADSKETAVPSLGIVKSMATQGKPAVPVTGLSRHRTTSGITYESDEVMLMEQIERESLRL